LLERLIDVDSLVDFSGSAKEIAVPIMGAGFVVMAFSVAVSLLLGVLDGSKGDEVSESKDAENEKKQAGFNGLFKGLTLFNKNNDDRNEKEAESSLAADSRQGEMMPRSDDAYYTTMYNDDDPDIARPTGGILWKRKENPIQDQTSKVYNDKEGADLWRMPLEELRSDAILTSSGNHKAEENSNNLETNGYTSESNGNEIQPVQEELGPRRKSPVDVLDNAEQTIVSPRRRG
jgi:hypothetical protein